MVRVRAAATNQSQAISWTAVAGVSAAAVLIGACITVTVTVGLVNKENTPECSGPCIDMISLANADATDLSTTKTTSLLLGESNHTALSDTTSGAANLTTTSLDDRAMQTLALPSPTSSHSETPSPSWVTTQSIAMQTPASTTSFHGETVPLRNLRSHLEALQSAAIASGNRRFCSPGHNASVQFVLATLNQMNPPLHVRLEEHIVGGVNLLSAQGAELAVIAPHVTRFSQWIGAWPGADWFWVVRNSGLGNVTGYVVPVANGGCQPSDFEHLLVAVSQGHTVVARILGHYPKSCDCGNAMTHAKLAGASAVITSDYLCLGLPVHVNGTTAKEFLPMVLMPTGTDLDGVKYQGCNATSCVAATVQLAVDGEHQFCKLRNVIAESLTGDPGNIVTVGAHLDSVSGGAGINDDGSGVAALLEMARILTRLDGRKLSNKVWLVWFDGEEDGMRGSAAHVMHLREAGQLWRVVAYLNLDMIASPNYIRGVYDGGFSDYELTSYDGRAISDAALNGSRAITQLFAQYFNQQGLLWELTPLTGRGDYDEHLVQGIPSGGLFTGAEKLKTEEQVALFGGTLAPFDECYHLACDDVSNIQWQLLQSNAEAAVAVLLNLSTAEDVRQVLQRPRNATMPTVSRARAQSAATKFWLDPSSLLGKETVSH